MLKIEGGIDWFLLGNGCKIVSSRRKNLIPASLTNILEKVSKKSEENGEYENVSKKVRYFFLHPPLHTSRLRCKVCLTYALRSYFPQVEMNVKGKYE